MSKFIQLGEHIVNLKELLYISPHKQHMTRGQYKATFKDQLNNVVFIEKDSKEIKNSLAMTLNGDLNSQLRAKSTALEKVAREFMIKHQLLDDAESAALELKLITALNELKEVL